MCLAIEVQNGMIERNSGLPPERWIEFRVGVHLGDAVEESDADLMGDGVNIAASARRRPRRRLDSPSTSGPASASSTSRREYRISAIRTAFAALGVSHACARTSARFCAIVCRSIS